MAHVARAFLQRGARHLLRVRARVREADGDLERPGADADLRADSHVARSRALIRMREGAVPVMEVDLEVRAPVVANGGFGEWTDDADPYVLLSQQKRGRMRIEDLAEVALGSRLPVCRCLHVEADVGQLGREGGRDEQGVLVGVGEELLGQAIFVVGAVDRERGDAGREPRNPMVAITRIVDRGRASGGGEEAQLVQHNPIEGREEDLAEGPVREGVPQLAPRSGRRSERHLPTWTPHRGRAWTSWCLHRLLSMKGLVADRIERRPGPSGEVAEWSKAPAC